MKLKDFMNICTIKWYDMDFAINGVYIDINYAKDLIKYNEYEVVEIGIHYSYDLANSAGRLYVEIK